jgi:hypothetical protein
MLMVGRQIATDPVPRHITKIHALFHNLPDLLNLLIQACCHLIEFPFLVGPQPGRIPPARRILMKVTCHRTRVCHALIKNLSVIRKMITKATLQNLLALACRDFGPAIRLVLQTLAAAPRFH